MLSSRTPNFEQSNAIVKKGGVLLSAGAGSGKTFVIIEHIVFLLREMRSKLSHDDLVKNAANLFSGITLMTFTKKLRVKCRYGLREKLKSL